MDNLYQIQCEVRLRTESIATAHGAWPCCKGCDDCCRSLAAVPRVSQAEWQPIASAFEALPAEVAASVRRRIRDSAGATRPVVCPLLDTDHGVCLVYDVRPIACRAYGFHADRREVLGCSRIEAIAEESPEIVWGNHAAFEDRLAQLGPAAELHHWLDAGAASP